MKHIKHCAAVAVIGAVGCSEPTAAGSVVADDVHIVAGSFAPGRQPDGNSVVFDAPGGLIVVDSGRHGEHQAQIVALSRSLGKPIATLVNTHWHLDHSGGNAELRAAFPGLRLATSRAVEGALDGFLARSLASAGAYLADAKVPGGQKADIRLDIAAIQDRRNMIADDAVGGATTLPLDGRELKLALATHAATDGDVWLYDPGSKTAVAGDLVTLPVPFLDTACPDGWREALGAIAAKPFQRLIPGHGAMMGRAEFERYRAAFGRLLDCTASDRDGASCGEAWIADLGSLLPASEQPRARAMLAYYVGERLRPSAKRQEYCARKD